MQALLKTALVVPVFNEAMRWREYYWHEITSSGIEIYFVDDGSTDNTAEILASSNLGTLLKLEKNRGKSEAVRFGISEVLKSGLDFDQIGFIDSDCAFEISEVIEIVENAPHHFKNGFDSVWTSRVRLAGHSISRTSFRHAIGRIIGTILSTSVKNFPYDSQCGFKIYQVNENLRQSFEYTSRTRWFFELEHLANYRVRNGESLRIWELPLKSWKDVQGSKIYSLRSVKLLYEISYIYMKLLRSR